MRTLLNDGEGKKQGFFGRNKYLILSFVLPFLLMTTAFTIGGALFFGSRQILVTDLWHQYYPFLVDLQDKLKEGGSLLYTWSVGMGVNYPALMSYYLASPLNFLSIFVPYEFLREFLALSVAVKIGFAGFSFAFFLRSTYRRNDISLTFFSGLFALCAFFMGYYWNVIWLDTVAIVPLVVSGFIALQKDGKYRLYVISLALSIITNYYIGFFVCIFILLCFFCYNICCCGSLKSFVKNFFRIAWTTVLSLLMTAVMTIPAFTALQNTYSAVNKFPHYYDINIGATDDLWGTLDAIRQVISNSITLVQPTSKEGLPNIYCGMIALFLAFLFLFSRKIRLREKILNVGMLIFFIISFIIRQLDYIWHGFHFTNMIPYRFSFLFSFVVVAMAYRAYVFIEDFSTLDAAMAAVLSAFVIILACFIKPLHAIIVSTVIVVGTFLALAVFYANKINKRALTAVICVIVMTEMICSVINGVTTVSFTTRNDYPRGEEDTENVITEMKNIERDTVDLWRSDFTSTQTLNDGALNRIRGVSVFSSMINVNTTKFAEDFGLAGWQSGNRYCYYESSPVTNLFLNLKYIISRNGIYGNTSYLEEAASSGKVKLLRNNAYLPMGFVVNSDLAQYYKIGKYTNDPIAVQNDFFSLATGINENVYQPLEVVSQGHTDSSVFKVSKVQNGVYRFSTEDSETKPHLKYNFIAPKDGMICFYMSVTNAENMKLMRNDEEVTTYYIKRGYLGCMGNFKAGDKISFYVDLKEKAKGSAYIRCAYFNEEVFNKGYDILSQSVMKADNVSDTLIEGTISVKSDGLFYASIPYEDSWKVYVDGRETEVTPVGDAMLAFPISKGKHTVSLEFRPQAFYTGMCVSMAAIIIFIICALIEGLRNKPLMRPLEDNPEWFVYEKKRPLRIRVGAPEEPEIYDEEVNNAVFPEDDGLMFNDEETELDNLLRETGLLIDDDENETED